MSSYSRWFMGLLRALSSRLWHWHGTTGSAMFTSRGYSLSSYAEYDVELAYLASIVFGTNAGATPAQATSATIAQTNPAVKWVFKQIAVENTNAASAATTVALYLNGVLIAPSAFMTPTPNGLGVSASGLPWIVLGSTDTLVIDVQGATVGDQIKIQGLYVQVSSVSS